MMIARVAMGKDTYRPGRGAIRTALGVLCALAILGTAPAAASAAFSVSGSVAPVSTQAGAHSNIVLQISFPDKTNDVKNLTIHLPPGVVGDPTATPLCTVSQLNSDSCPAKTQVGSVSTGVTAAGVLPLTVTGTLYNLTPQSGEPARFGIVLRPVGGLLGKIVLQSAVKLRATDYGLDTIINNIPKTSNGIATHIDSMTVTLRGAAGNPAKPFMRNPTSCSQATSGFDATDYNSDNASGTSSFTPTGCGNLDFSPTFLSSIGSSGHTTPATHPPLQTVVEQDVGEAGVRNVDVALPQDVGADLNALANHCPEASFVAGTCPANTVIGSAKATSPLLTQALTGPVSIVEPVGVGLPRLGLDLQGPLHIQLFGAFTLTADGQGNSFTDIPDIPLSHFELNFDADKLIVLSRDLCSGATPEFPTSFTGWNGATQSGDVPVKVNGCGKGGGGAGKPKAKIAVKKASGDKPALKLKVKEPKTAKAGTKIKKTKLKLPKSLRFAGKRAFFNGFRVHASGKVRALPTHKRVTVTTPTGSRKVVEKIASGALLRRAKVAGRKLHFKLAVTDTTGKTTKLKLTTKAKP